MWGQKFLVGLLLVALSAGCSQGGDETLRRSTPSSTDPSDAGGPGTGSTAPPAASTAPTTPPAATACPQLPPRAKARPDRPVYDLKVDIRPAEGIVNGELSVRFTPDIATDRLVFRLWPNGPKLARAGSRLETSQIVVKGKSVETALEQPTILVARTGPLAARRPIDASLTFKLTLPRNTPDRVAFNGDTVRLGSFFPILPWEPGRGWSTDAPTTNFAEASVAPTADFTVSITVPEGYQPLATGLADASGRWVAKEVRDFAISVGHFRTETRTIDVGHPVTIIVGVDSSIRDERPDVYVDTVTKSIQLFSQRFGAYPWPSYTLAITPDLPGGIEYPMHVMQGPGTRGGTTSHEVGHEWFYGLVGNNQGRDPWLDEGLTSYAEYRFTGELARAMARKLPPSAKDHVGEPMTYWETRQAIYYASVYRGGAVAVASMGSIDQVDCALAHLVAKRAHAIVTPEEAAQVFESVIPDARAKLRAFGIKV
ncbi:MAG TPA: M1 family aminopeptidase [Acidimicrobiales bacterium]|nr:M1 family aminopeptidase [Acidimicrobiales bacterium]